jgi:hypothetical protein
MFGLLKTKPKSTVIDLSTDFVVRHEHGTKLERLETRKEIEAIRFATREKQKQVEQVKLAQRKEQTKQIAIKSMDAMIKRGRLRSIDDRELLSLVAESLMHGSDRKTAAKTFARWAGR